MITATFTRRYLIEDNGWTTTEVDKFFELYGMYSRSEQQWELDIVAFLGLIA